MFRIFFKLLWLLLRLPVPLLHERGCYYVCLHTRNPLVLPSFVINISLTALYGVEVQGLFAARLCFSIHNMCNTSPVCRDLKENDPHRSICSGTLNVAFWRKVYHCMVVWIKITTTWQYRMALLTVVFWEKVCYCVVIWIKIDP